MKIMRATPELMNEMIEHDGLLHVITALQLACLDRADTWIVSEKPMTYSEAKKDADMYKKYAAKLYKMACELDKED